MYSQIDSNKRKTVILIALFIAIVTLIGWAFSQLTDVGYSGLFFAGIFSLVMALAGYYKGDALALAQAGAIETKREENPYVFRMVENLAITAGLPVPRVYLIQDDAMNAFATGRDPRHASIAITTGAIQHLENEELEGVIAHELSHIKNYDIRLMTMVLVLVGILALLADWFMRMQWMGRGNRRESNSKAGQMQGFLVLAGLILVILSPLIGKLIQFSISRKREFLADASGALLTRYPEGLARALEKIHNKNLPLKRANNATAHLYISNPFSGKKHLFSKLFSTHPPMEERIQALRTMA